MHQTAKIFMTGRSQAVRLPVEFRFDVEEVFIRRDPDTGDVVLSRRPNNWDDLIDLVRKNAGQDLSIPRRQIRELRDPNCMAAINCCFKTGKSFCIATHIG
jgi:antitoxin VapB